MKTRTSIALDSKRYLQAGVTLIEIVVVMGIMALAIIPIYNNIFGTRIQVSKAKFAYIAMHLCREKVEEIMSLPFDEMDEFRQGYTKVEGPVVSKELLETVYRGANGGRTVTTMGRSLGGGFVGGSRVVPGGGGLSLIDPTAQVAEGDYPAEYMRFERQVKVKKQGKRFKKITVTVRWYEKGEQDKRENKYMYSLNTLVANHKLAAYKGGRE